MLREARGSSETYCKETRKELAPPLGPLAPLSTSLACHMALQELAGLLTPAVLALLRDDRSPPDACAEAVAAALAPQPRFAALLSALCDSSDAGPCAKDVQQAGLLARQAADTLRRGDACVSGSTGWRRASNSSHGSGSCCAGGSDAGW